MKTFTLLLIVTITLPFLTLAQQPPLNLDQIEMTLKATPDDPIFHYRKCQALFAKGEEQESINYAAIALTKFKAARKNLSWMLLGSISTDKYKIDVHYNMGPAERTDRKDGIVCPYSFRVWTADADRKLVRILDFELGYLNGELLTAAIEESKGDVRANFGTVDPKSDFATVKKKVLEIVGN